MFGVPGKGMHRWRILNLAVVDVVGTIVVASLVAYYFRLPYWSSIGCAFLLGILFHWLFCVNTTVNKLLFGKM